jgi:hypothetical protein
MTIQEAKNAIKNGFKVRHRFFLPHEYIQQGPDYSLIDEDGREMANYFWQVRNSHSWQEGWEIVDENNIPKRKSI